MILGIGNDIIEIERIHGVIERHGERFLNRTFTRKEQDYCLKHFKSSARFAGRFAAKEAIAKALGTGFNDSITFLDIEIVNNIVGKPEVVISSALKELIGDSIIHISISHSDNYATAFAVIST
jgi:holo-[acyl-carrier protein] synthase